MQYSAIRFFADLKKTQFTLLRCPNGPLLRWLAATAEERAEEKIDLQLAPSAVQVHHINIIRPDCMYYAGQRLLELKSESPSSALRVTVEGGGCSGFQYKFSLDDSPHKQDDLVLEQEGARLLCDKISYEFLKGSTVEFADSLMRSAFQIKDNPNSDSSCGCGTSFSAKT